MLVPLQKLATRAILVRTKIANSNVMMGIVGNVTHVTRE